MTVSADDDRELPGRWTSGNVCGRLHWSHSQQRKGPFPRQGLWTERASYTRAFKHSASSSCLCDFPTIMGWVSRNWESNKPFLWSYFITSVRYENNTNTVASWSKGQQVSWLTAHCPVKHKVAQGRGWVVNSCKSALSTISLEGHGSTINPKWGAKYSLSSHFIL